MSSTVSSNKPASFFGICHWGSLLKAFWDKCSIYWMLIYWLNKFMGMRILNKSNFVNKWIWNMFGEVSTTVVNITYIKIILCTWWHERWWPDLDLVSPRNFVTSHRSRVRCLVATVLEWFCYCACSKYSIYPSQDWRLLSFDVYFISCTTFYFVFFSSFCHFVRVFFSLTTYQPQILYF